MGVGECSKKVNKKMDLSDTKNILSPSDTLECDICNDSMPVIML